MSHTASTEAEAFPAVAQALLTAFYTARGVNESSMAENIRVLRQVTGLDDAIITADHGIDGEADTLRILEFYHLTKQGVL